MNNREKRLLIICSWVFILDAVFAGSAAFVDLIPNHAFDASWPAHARFHVTMAASHMFALAAITALIAWFPFRERRRWSWFALAVFTVFGFGTIPLIAQWQGSGPPIVPFTLIVTALIAALIALALSWKLIFGKHLASGTDHGIREKAI